jgi:clan AA aspartic protease (TIGR02281 family)
LGWYTHQYWGVTDSPPAVSRNDGVAAQKSYGGDAPQDAGADPLGAKRPQDRAFGDMLRERRYEEALEAFNKQRSRAGRERYRRELMAHLDDLIRSGDYRNAGSLVSIYLQQDYRDSELLQIRARLYYLQNDMASAIDTLYEARSYEYRPEQLQAITEEIRNFVAQYAKRLQDADDHAGRLQLYEHLTVLEPDYSPYFIDLAEAQMALDRLEDARRSLALVEFDPRVAEQARQMRLQIDDTVTFSQPTPIVVPLIREGSHFVVNARINESVTVRLMLDTGASVTVLSNDALRAAGIVQPAEARVRRFSTANGLVEGLVYRIEGLAVGDQTVANIDIAGLDLPDLRAADGLLGMNYLSHFKFFIDQDKNELRLSAPL